MTDKRSTRQREADERLVKIALLERPYSPTVDFQYRTSTGRTLHFTGTPDRLIAGVNFEE
jgi:hypothetical protein